MSLTLSVITACFNSEKTISYTLASILKQDFKDFEYILVDGKSTDSTLELIKKFQPEFDEKGIRYSIISEPDSGIYDAWNKGLALAKGNWITFIGSDDVILPGALSAISEIARNQPGTDFITAKAKILKNNKVSREFGQEWKWDIFKKEMKILHAGGWHNSDYFKKHGQFDTDFKIVGDYEILLRKKADLKVQFLDQFIIEMGGDGVSSRLVLQSLKEVKKAKSKNQISTPFQICIDYYWVYFKIKVKSILN